MSIEEKLEQFSTLVRAYGRSREIERQVRGQGALFDADLVERVADEHREKAVRIMCEILDRVGAVELALMDARGKRREQELARISLEYQLDEVALHRRVGADSEALRGREQVSQRALDQLEREADDTSSSLQRLRRALDLWYDVGADSATTM